MRQNPSAPIVIALVLAACLAGCNTDDGWIVRHDLVAADAPRLCQTPLDRLADERRQLAEAAAALEPVAPPPAPVEPVTLAAPASAPAVAPAAETPSSEDVRAEAPEPPRKRKSKRKPEPAACIDLATASAPALQALPGVGPSLAARIVEARERKPFTAPRQLERVKGIGAARARKIAPLLCPM